MGIPKTAAATFAGPHRRALRISAALVDLGDVAATGYSADLPADWEVPFMEIRREAEEIIRWIDAHMKHARDVLKPL